MDGGAPGMLMYTAPQRRAGVGALFRVHKNGTEPGPRPDLRSEMPIAGEKTVYKAATKKWAPLP